MNSADPQVKQRYLISGAVSLALHGLALALISWEAASRPPVFRAPESPPLVLNLAPPDERPPRRLVDPGAPAEENPVDSELIAEHASRAQDMVEGPADESGPVVERIEEFEEIPRPAQASAPQVPPEPPAESASQKTTEEHEPEKAEPLQVARLTDSTKGTEKAVEPNPTRVAEAPAMPESAPQQARGPERGGVSQMGLLSFEAMRHELAPYMKEVQRRVEKQWRILLEIKYRGAQPAKAVVECAIAPSGKVEYVRIVDRGATVGFAPICKEAIERAGPFPAFPFEVPSTYSERNLQIQWTFNFL